MQNLLQCRQLKNPVSSSIRFGYARVQAVSNITAAFTTCQPELKIAIRKNLFLHQQIILNLQ